MKIALPEYDTSAIGGGWSFISNFIKSMGDTITIYENADIFFIPSASMVSRETVQKAKDDNKKIVLRCDNIIRNSRNRNTGMTRMKDFADWSDLVIFQSNFAMELLQPFLRAYNYEVIHNSVDENIFNSKGREEGNRYLYGTHSTDSTKNWEMARVKFQDIHNEEKAFLNLFGRLPVGEEHNFDFYNGEQYKYWGYIQDPNVMANIYRQSDYFLYSYFNDACSNTLIEAIVCGCKPVDCFGMIQTGGAVELIWREPEYFKLERMATDYINAMKGL